MSAWRKLSVAVFAMAVVAASCAEEPSRGGQGGSPFPTPTQGGRYGPGSGTASPDTPGEGGGSVLTITQNNYAFSPPQVSIKTGETITVKNANPSTPHTFTIGGKGIDITNSPGESQAIRIDLPPGNYPFVCTFHQGLGMQGRIGVT